MSCSAPAPSAALLAANGRLHALRARVPSASRPPSDGDGRLLLPPVVPAVAPFAPDRGGVDSAESAPLRAYPSLLVGLLKQGRAPAGRLWLLCRHHDRAGRGWVALADVRAWVAGDGEAKPLFAPRRLRRLLAQGTGVFWERDDRDRLWLYGAARVAARLGVGRLSGAPVLLPPEVVRGGIGRFKAFCYAAFHGGRRSANPISRQTLTDLTGVPARTQRAYDRVAGVETTACFTTAHGNPRDAAWRHGAAVFLYKDSRGRSALARQLPNRYRVPRLVRAARGRQRQINRRLQDLVTQPAQGNGSTARSVRYVATAAQAPGALRQGHHTVCWPDAARTKRHLAWYLQVGAA